MIKVFVNNLEWLLSPLYHQDLYVKFSGDYQEIRDRGTLVEDSKGWVALNHFWRK